jgi:hypothetical protein
MFQCLNASSSVIPKLQTSYKWNPTAHTFNPLRTKRICFIQGYSPYRAVNTFRFGYTNQSVNDVHGKSYFFC